MTADRQLPLFERRKVAAAQVRITKAGDGLSDALAVTPTALHLGQDVYYVLRGKVTQVNHRTKTVDEIEVLVRQHTVQADSISEIDSELAEKLLNEAEEELARRQAEADAQMSIYDDDVEDPLA